MRSPLTDAVARRVGGPLLHRISRLAGGPPPGLRRGVGRPAADVPVLAVVLVSATSDVAEVLLTVTSRALDLYGGFTPIFLVDAPVLAPFRRAGYVVELVGPAGLEEAVREVRLSYDCRSVLVVDGATAVSEGRLRELVAAVRPVREAGPVARLRSLLRRVESFAG